MSTKKPETAKPVVKKKPGPKPKAKKPVYRDYSPKDKAAALVLLDWNNGNVRKTAKDIGVPEGTLRSWKTQADENPEIKTAADEMAGSLADQIEQTLRIGLAEARKKLPKASLSAINSTVSMLAEKHQVINNRPSDIQDFRGNKIEELSAILVNAAERKAQKDGNK